MWELALCAIWKTLPSVLMEGAMIISAWCMSLIVRAPHMPIAVRNAPTRFMVPSATEEGPSRISLSEPRLPTLILVPLGRSGWGLAIPQL